MKQILFLVMTCIASHFLAQSPDIQWQVSLGGTDVDEANSVQQTVDGGYIVVGYTESTNEDIIVNYGERDYWLVKLDASGAIQWQTSLGGSDIDEAYSVQQTTDGGYIVGGFTFSIDTDITANNGQADYWIVKLDGSGVIQWQKSLGGSVDDLAYSIRQTVDGGYIIAGSTTSIDGDITLSNGYEDVWIVKLDENGTIKWQKSFGGSSMDYASDIKQTSDGGYIVSGSSGSDDGDVVLNNGFDDYWILKIDGVGTFQWQTSLGGSDLDHSKCVQQTSDGGYVISGNTRSNDVDVTVNQGMSDYWIVKLDNLGTIQWQKTFGGTDEDIAYSIQQTNDGGYIIAGYSASTDGNITSPYGQNDCWLIKIDGGGALVWEKSLGGSGSDEARSIQQTTDGGYVLVGYSASNDGDLIGNHGANDYWVVKLAPDVITTITEKTIENFISIYPNPSKGIFKFNFNALSVQSIIVKNIVGEVITDITVKSSIQTVDLSDQSEGIYFATIKTAIGSIVKKVVVD